MDHGCKSKHELKYNKHKKVSACLNVSLLVSGLHPSLGIKKYRAEKLTESRRTDCLSSQIPSLSPAWAYPKECNFCTIFRVQHKGERYKPYKITTYTAENTIKAAAKDNGIKDLDLIAKEFKFHKHCYNQYTNGYAHGSSSSKANADRDIATEKTSSYDTGKFEEVKKFVIDEVIGLGRAIPMKVLHDIYGIAVGDDRCRSKLKMRLKNYFKEQISFVTPKYETAEIVMTTECLELLKLQPII